jgi:hypothetical protein
MIPPFFSFYLLPDEINSTFIKNHRWKPLKKKTVENLNGFYLTN